MTISSDYAKYAIEVLSTRSEKCEPIAEKQRQLQIGILREMDAWRKYMNRSTRKFDVDHEDLKILNDETELLVDSMFMWEYLDSDLQEIDKEYHMVINSLSKPGINIVWTGEDANGFFYHIDWKRLKSIANNNLKSPSLFAADVPEEYLADMGL